MATLLSVNVGLPKNVEWQGSTVYTGVWKHPVDGPRLVRRLNVDGDGQGDLNGHGGEQRAVLVYQLESYRHWEAHFGRTAFEHGQFGENFTVDGLSDDEVCIGDRYRIGGAEFEVTQPRVTCFRVGMRLGQPQLPALLVAHHRPGFYLRVITEGHVRAGDQIVRTRVGRHAVSVADIDALLYLPDRDIEQLRAAVDIPALSPGWRQSFDELLEAAHNGTQVAAPPVGVEPGWPGFRRLRVADLVPEGSAVTSVYLTAETGGPLPRPKAGQYITLRAAGAGDPAPVRSYSLSSGPGAEIYRISVKHESHGIVSGYLHSRLRPGAILDVAAPRGDFVLTDDSNPVLLISAGIGVTPVLAMLHQLAAARSTRDVWWIHTARNADQHAFAAEAHGLLQALPNGHECIFYTAADAATGGPIISGRPTRAGLAGLGLPTDATAYICGPAAFMADLQDALPAVGLAPDRIHTELFAARSAINPGRVDVHDVTPHQPPGPPGTGPQITFARSGLTVRWSQGHASLLELADACDIPTRYSCRSGVCHTCITPVLAGDIAYAPDPLEMPGSDEALICCAHPDSDLVLDL
ncbi:MAG TPA: MOSC and FAD-binding oxidoreductase domain-containing protein [Mycobacteriales bacterium]|nr:MOSC and FAD-binding oxidoreductase domain-containing protein [Mycobacteriales bacterium]